MKVYELKKGTKIIHKEEILEFEEIRGDRAIFYNEWGIEIDFPDFLDVDEIGEIAEVYEYREDENFPTLF
ncbi:succinyl-diaminopimelate desuccinylase [Caminibacter sp.]